MKVQQVMDKFAFLISKIDGELIQGLAFAILKL